MSEHTKGPWSHTQYEAGAGWSEVCGSDGKAILYLDHSGCGGGFDEPWSRPLMEQEANARLIAAAPDLLEALRVLVEAVDREDNPTDEGLGGGAVEMDAARLVIAKAEGR